MGQQRSAVYHFKGMGGLVNIYYNMSACSVRISDENPFLSVAKMEDFINFLLRFYKLCARGGDLSGHFAIATKWV